ncbi:MAG: hypothetical protein WEE20_04665, partial [Bacteroidota bacterium]
MLIIRNDQPFSIPARISSRSIKQSLEPGILRTSTVWLLQYTPGIKAGMLQPPVEPTDLSP